MKFLRTPESWILSFATPLLLLALPSVAQPVPTHRVALEIERPGLARLVPVTADLDALGLASDSVRIHELVGDERRAIPAQVASGPRRTLHWLVETGGGDAGKRVFEISGADEGGQDAGVTLRSDQGQLVLASDDRDLLTYQFGHMAPPEGVDPVYGRSGFIHPLRAPHGQVLTRVQPADHYHHYGIWNPWTQVEFRGRTIDFWNLAKREATVRFAQFATLDEGAVFGEYRALHEHVVLPDTVAMTELQSVRVYRLHGDDAYLVDLVIEMSCATDDPVRLLEYRYGGLGWRATEEWHKGNSRVLTSEGRTRVDADGSLARWCLVEGEVGDERAGVVLMSHPANTNHPEPLRVWPENSEGRGDVFVNFSPTKNRDWLLEPKRSYLLRYRLLVYNGTLDAAAAEQAWRDFAHPPAPSKVSTVR